MDEQFSDYEKRERKIKMQIAAGFIGAITLIILLFTFGMSINIVGAGERGVLLKWGAVQTNAIQQPGLHFTTPFSTSIKNMNVQTQKLEVDASSASKDLQSVTTKVALNFNADPGQVDKLYQEVGKTYDDTVIAPALQEAVKNTTAQFTAEELITKRSEVNAGIRANIENRLKNSHVIVTDFSIVNFSFSEDFDKAIEAKQTAEQNAKRAENDLKRIQIEAQQKIETAKADAESIRIQGQALKESNGLVELKAVEKWDGKLPQYMLGEGSTPFINLNK